MKLSYEAILDEQTEHTNIRVAKITIVPAGTALLTVIITSKCGFKSAEGIQTTIQTHQIPLQ